MPRIKSHASSADEYLEAIPEPSRQALKALRENIRSVIPDSDEIINYGIIVFKHDGKGLVGIGASKNYCSFYLMSTSIIPEYKGKLGLYDTSGGTIHFTADKPIPSDLVRELVKARIDENEAMGRK